MHYNKSHPDQKYIEALLTNDSRILSELYKKFSGKVVSFIQRNSGSIDDAKDIIQESLIAIYHQARDKELILSCPFDAYFFLLCKRKWLNKLKLKKGVTIDDENLSISDDSVQMAFETEIFEFKNRLFESKFNELGEKCQEVLRLSFTVSSMEEVAKILGVTYGYVRKKKSLCLGQLTELIQKSSEFKTLKDN